MPTFSKDQQEDSSKIENDSSKKQNNAKSTFQFKDNRPESILQEKLQNKINNSTQVKQLIAWQEKADRSSGSKVIPTNNAPIQLVGWKEYLASFTSPSKWREYNEKYRANPTATPAAAPEEQKETTPPPSPREKEGENATSSTATTLPITLSPQEKEKETNIATSSSSTTTTAHPIPPPLTTTTTTTTIDSSPPQMGYAQGDSISLPNKGVANERRIRELTQLRKALTGQAGLSKEDLKTVKDMTTYIDHGEISAIEFDRFKRYLIHGPQAAVNTTLPVTENAGVRAFCRTQGLENKLDTAIANAKLGTVGWQSIKGQLYDCWISGNFRLIGTCTGTAWTIDAVWKHSDTTKGKKVVAGDASIG